MKNIFEESRDEDLVESEVIEESAPKINIEKYKDSGGLTIKKLNFGLWYLEHKRILLITLYVFLAIVGFVTWFSFFKTFGYYVLIGMNDDKKIVNDMVHNPGINHEQVLRTAAQAIQVESANVILNSSGTYDVVAKISNLNKRYYSNFSYTLNINNKTIGPFEDFILPSEEKFLILLDQNFSRRPGSVKLDIENSWNKIDGHVIADWPAYRDNYLDFSVTEKVFSNPRESNLSEKLNLSIVEFNVTNNSAYSFYEVDLNILLYYRGKLVSVSKYPVEKFKSGETRHINITWPGKVNRVDSIDVVPAVNIMTDNVMYIP